jgi:hypothetical protein
MKKKTTTIVLIVTVIMEILFVTACFLFPERVLSQLIVYWHIGFIAELLACAGIKVAKVFNAYDKEDAYTDDEEDIVG